MKLGRLAMLSSLSFAMACTHATKPATNASGGMDLARPGFRGIASTDEGGEEAFRRLPMHSTLKNYVEFANSQEQAMADKGKTAIYGMNKRLLAANVGKGETRDLEKLGKLGPGKSEDPPAKPKAVVQNSLDVRPYMMAKSAWEKTSSIPNSPETANKGYYKTAISENEARARVVEKAQKPVQRTPQQVTGCTTSWDDSYEGNDSRSSAYDLSGYEDRWLSSVSGRGVQLDPDWYKITVSDRYRNLIVDLRYSYSCSDMDLEVYDSNGNLVARSERTSDDEYLNLNLSRGGTYYIAIYFSNKGGYYDLKWKTNFTGAREDSYEANDSRYSAYDLSGWENRWLSSLWGEGVAADDDYYKITVRQGFLRVQADLRFLHRYGDLELYLLDENGSTVRSSTSSDDDEYISVDVPRPGTYYIRVYPYGSTSAPNNYDLKWNLVQTGPVWTEDGYENNDSRTSATQINLGFQLNGNQYDEDWYRVNVSDTGRRLQVNLGFTNRDGDIDMQVYDANGRELRSSFGTSDSEFIDMTVSGGGVYYVRVFGDNTGNPYRLTVNGLTTEPSEDLYAPNNTLATAYDLSGRSGVWLSSVAGLGRQKSDDYFKIYVHPDLRHLYVDLKFTAAQGNLNLELFNDQGVLVAYSRGGSDTEQMDMFIPDGARFYYLKVTGPGASQTYDLKWSTTPINTNLPVPAGKVAVVEYYNPTLRHYFMTANPDEQWILDTQHPEYPGWYRTGYAWLASQGPGEGLLGVCRFFAMDRSGKPVTAFYTASQGECDAVKRDMANYWRYDGISYYVRPLLDGNGTCAAGGRALHRMYNGGRSGYSNHRYIMDLIERPQMEAKGYSYEAPVFCSEPM